MTADSAVAGWDPPQAEDQAQLRGLPRAAPPAGWRPWRDRFKPGAVPMQTWIKRATALPGQDWPLLFPADVAQVAGVSRHWIHQLTGRSRRHWNQGEPWDGDLPVPHAIILRGHPAGPAACAWTPWAIQEWLENKPLYRNRHHTKTGLNTHLLTGESLEHHRRAA